MEIECVVCLSGKQELNFVVYSAIFNAYLIRSHLIKVSWSLKVPFFEYDSQARAIYPEACLIWIFSSLIKLSGI